MLGLCWAIIGPMLGHLGPSWGHVGPKLGHLGPSWRYVGAGISPENFMSDLCCFLGRAKNTVNYGVFLTERGRR